MKVAVMKARGFTLVEMMISMVIGLLVTALVAVVFAGSAKTYRLADTNAELIETGRNAMAAMERDIRVAGYRGCNSNNVGGSSTLRNIIITPATYADDLLTGVRVYDAVGAGYAPALPTAMPGIVAGSDVLVVRMPTGPVFPITATMAAGTSDIALATAPAIAAGSRAIAASCSNATAFRVSAVVGTNVQHAAAGLNTTGNLGAAFDIDAVLIPYVTRAYYVGASSSGVAGETSLYMRDEFGTAEELAENVQQMQILVGEDSDGDMVANRYRNVTAATNFATVMALQIHLLTRGRRDNESSTTLTFDFAGQSLTAADQFARRVFTSTVLLRNRTL
jgi:type IV pilus assembly protein PilW